MAGLTVHHLNCATMCPVACSLMGRDSFVCHCLLVETDDGLVLVDTGLGMADVDGTHRLPFVFTGTLRPECRPEETAVAQVRALGYQPEDVRHIVVTHLDLDHAGGLPDFPEATVHVHATEHGLAQAPARLHQRMRYRGLHWAHGPDWRTYTPDGEPWFGFEAVRELDGLPPEILIIPLHGHSLGHCGVAVDSTDGWMLHAGDAYFSKGEVDDGSCPRLLRIFQSFLADDNGARLANQGRLRELAATGDVAVFCAHDEIEYAGCCGGEGASAASSI